MYGYAPPTVIAIDPDLLVDCGAFMQIAGSLRQEAERRPIWAVVSAPSTLLDAADNERTDLVAAWYRDPRDAPEHIDVERAAADALAQHAAEQGMPLAVRVPPIPTTPHAPASAIVAGAWWAAAQMARLLAAPHVIAWVADAELVERSVDGIPFVAADPRMTDWHGRARV